MTRLKGSITVFLAIVLIFLIGVAGALFESVRFNVAKEVVLDTAYLSLQNVMAHYQRELWDDYHVFFLDGASLKGDEGIKKMANEYLTSMINPERKSLIGGEAGFQRVGFTEAMVEGDCRHFVKQAVEYMKLAAPADALKGVAGSLSGGEGMNKGQEALKKMISAKIKAERKLLTLEKKKEKIREKYAEINKEVLEIKKFAEDLEKGKDVGELREKLKEHKKSFERTKAEIGKLKEDIKEEETLGKSAIEDYKKELAENKEDLSPEDYKNFKDSADSPFKEEREETEKFDKNEEGLERIFALSQQEEVSKENLKKEIAALEPEKEDEREEAKKELEKYERNTADLMEEGGEGDFVFNLLGGSGIKVSKKAIQKTVWKDFGEAEGEDGSSLMDKGLFFLYMKKHFKHFLSEKKEADKKRKEALDYGLEYLVSGELSDLENLKGMAKRLFSVRTALWFSYFLSRPDKVAEAAELATATVGILGPAAVLAVKTAILLGWSAQEARTDVGELLRGREIALHPSSPGIKIGYEKYLDAFLIAAVRHWPERTVKLVEQNIRLRYFKEFQADNCFSGTMAEVKAVVEPRFFRIGLVKRMITGELKPLGFEYQLSESLSR